jgi:hypothetical protein
MKMTEERKMQKATNTSKRKALTLEIDTIKSRRRDLYLAIRTQSIEAKEALIAEISQSEMYEIKQLLAQTPLAVSMVYGATSLCNEEVKNYNVLCREFNLLKDRLRNQKAKTAKALCDNNALYHYNLF